MVEWDWQTYFLFGMSLFFAFICLRQYDCFKFTSYSFLYLICGLIPCFILFAFRNQSVGLDLIRYAYTIDCARLGPKSFFLHVQYGEILSYGIMYLSYHLGGIQPFIFITSFVQYLLISLFLIRLHNRGFNVSIVFLIFFSVVELRTCSMVRNGLAIVASFCAYTFLFDDLKKRKWYWFFSILAFGFHNSAIINVPIYFICTPVSGSRWNVYRGIAEKIFALSFVLFIIYTLKNGGMNSLISTVAEGKYSGYERSNSWGWGNFAIRIPLLILVLIYLKDLKLRYGNNIICCFYLMIFDLIISQTKYIYNDFERFTQYSVFGEIFIISLLYDFFRERLNFPIQFVYFVLIAIYFTYYMYKWAVLSGYGLMPFKFLEL